MGIFRRPITWIALFGGSGYGYYKYKTGYFKPPPDSFPIPIRVRSPDGTPVKSSKEIKFLSDSDIQNTLSANLSSISLDRPESKLRWRYDTARVASNNPIEDADAQTFIKSEEKMFGDSVNAGDMLFFAIMDGHAGYSTSRLLAKTLIPSVILELTSLTPEAIAASAPSSSTSNWGSLLSWSKSSGGLDAIKNTTYPYFSDPKYVSTAIRTAFSKLDSQIVNTPVTLVNNLLKSGAPTESDEYKLAVASILPALSGSCALLGMIDVANKDLYVACTGDSRALAGFWDEDTLTGRGVWRMEVLTEDQTGRNLNELKRMQSEHPASEAPYVIQRGRVLGGLEPTRAFGDANYKWSEDFQKSMNRVLKASGTEYKARRVPAEYKTPPYVIPTPEVTHRKLQFEPTPIPGSLNVKSSFKFLVLATDGLWDQLNSKEVAWLVAEHLNRDGKKGKVAVDRLTHESVQTSAAGIDGKSASTISQKGAKGGEWVFEDENVAKHLVRNALARGSAEELKKILSIPAPLSRSFRDDITVTVVWWEKAK